MTGATAASAPSATPWTDDATDACWSRFARAETREDRLHAWLEVQCARIPGASSALVLAATGEGGSYRPAAVWPHDGDQGTDVRHLADVAQRALTAREGVVQTRPGAVDAGGTTFQIAYPLAGDGHDAAPFGAIVVDGRCAPGDDLQTWLRELHWGAAWLDAWQRREQAQRDRASSTRAGDALAVLGVVLDASRYRAACTALVTELARRLDCDRVSLGVAEFSDMRMTALSHSASFGHAMNLVRCVEDAMDEARDQHSVVTLPLPPEQGYLVTRAHQALAAAHGAASVCTVPVLAAAAAANDPADICLCLERPAPFDAQELAFIETVAELAAPLLLRHRAEERSLPAHAARSARSVLGRVFGTGHLGTKLAVTLLALLLGAGLFARIEHRVSVDAAIEGAVQRAMTAPFDGYVSSAAVRAGDVVETGALLATLDDRDLRVERARLATHRTQFVRERRRAVATRERAQVKILDAQVAQAQAQLALVDEQLARTRLLAPFAGVVVSGDLSQRLGAPVQRGDLLFELAPLAGYRIALDVDERDIDAVQPGTRGRLQLGALPGMPLDLEVTRVTPVARAREGRNLFRVEARLGSERLRPGETDGIAGSERLRPGETDGIAGSERLRPGMRGIARLEVGERAPLAAWTARLRQWLVVQLWRWRP